MGTLSDILGAIIAYAIFGGMIVLFIGGFLAALGLTFPKLRKKKDDDPDWACRLLKPRLNYYIINN